MPRKEKRKYYAIKYGKGVKHKIVNTWDECSKLVLGYPAVYKSFLTLEEAKEYLGKADVTKVREQVKAGIKKKEKLKSTTKLVQARLPKELYEKFEEKCKEYEWETDKAIINLIKEWVL